MNVLRTLRLPDIASTLNALLGFCALVTALRGRPDVAVLLVLLAAAVDGVDGFLARRIEPSVLGGDLDSLSDLISFGAAPPFIALAVFDGHWLVWVLGCVYLSCGVFRLARFNVSPKDSRLFEGLPITGAGVVSSVSVLLDGALITALLLLCLSALMVSRVPYPKLRDFRLVPFFLLLGLGAAALGWYKADIWYSALVVFSALMVYLGLPVVLWLTRER